MNYATSSKRKYLFYTMFHPVTGFEEMKYNHKGSVLYANLLCLAFTLTNILKAVAEAFLFRTTEIEDVNILWTAVGCVGGLLIFSAANWMFCTLLDGKGKFSEIWTVMCYSMLPYVLISVPMTILGHVFTLEEAVFYTAVQTLVIGWSGLMALIGLMVVHEFTIPKNIVTVLLSVIGILLILFLALLIFSLFRNVYTFFATIVAEVLFRL